MNLLCLLIPLLVAGPAETSLVVTHLRLIDPVGRSVSEGSLFIVGGQIREVGPADGAGFDAEVPRWDGEGRFATRGFVDVSTVARLQVSPGHRDELDAASARSLFLAAGVHQVLDLGATTSDGFAGAAGPVIVAPGGVGSDLPGAFSVSNPQEARATVATLVAEGCARVSVFMDRGRNRRGLDEATLAAVLGAAGNVPVAVYAGTWRDVHDALAAGADWIVQIPAGPPPPPVMDQIRQARPMWTPALAVGADFMALMSVDSLRATPSLARALPAEMRTDYGEVRVPQGRLSSARMENESRMHTLEILRGAGVQLVAGSQSGGLGTAHGWTFLRELHWWEQAGVDAWTILAAATGEDRGEPGFVPGAPADFNVYGTSPVESGSAYFEPAVVFAGGQPHTPAALAGRVVHDLTEDIPANPLPGGNRWSLLLISVGGFALLLFLRRLIKQAAARALES